MGFFEWWDSVYQPHVEVWGIFFAFCKICIGAAVLTMFSINFSFALQARDDINYVAIQQQFSIACGDILEASAAERGASSAFVGSNRTDENFPPILDTLRDTLDDALNVSIPAMEKYATRPDQISLTEQLIDWSLTLPAFRAQVDNVSDTSLTINQVIAFYTGINSLLILGASNITVLQSSIVQKGATAWASMLAVYDNYGRQRALGASALEVATDWPPNGHMNYIIYAGMANAFSSSLNSSTTVTTQVAFFSAMTTPLSLYVLGLRDTMMTLNVPGDLGISPIDYYNNFTSFLAELYQIRLLTLDDFNNAMASAESEAHDAIVRNSLGLAFGIVACLYIIAEAALSFYAMKKRQQKVKDLDKQFGNEGKNSNWN